MTFLENKKIFFALCDEYAPNSIFFTEDEDIRDKVNLLYSSAYEELSNWRTPIKLKELSVSKYTEMPGYEKLKLPKHKSIKSITCLDEYNNIGACDYRIVGEYIFLSNSDNYTYNIEYVPFLEPIGVDTEDDFELEIEQDLQELLPWNVAADLFATDPGQDWQVFNSIYQRKLQMIKMNKMAMGANVSEGEFD